MFVVRRLRLCRSCFPANSIPSFVKTWEWPLSSLVFNLSFVCRPFCALSSVPRNFSAVLIWWSSSRASRIFLELSFMISLFSTSLPSSSLLLSLFSINVGSSEISSSSSIAWEPPSTCLILSNILFNRSWWCFNTDCMCFTFQSWGFDFNFLLLTIWLLLFLMCGSVSLSILPSSVRIFFSLLLWCFKRLSSDLSLLVFLFIASVFAFVALVTSSGDNNFLSLLRWSSSCLCNSFTRSSFLSSEYPPVGSLLCLE